MVSPAFATSVAATRSASHLARAPLAVRTRATTPLARRAHTRARVYARPTMSAAPGSGGSDEETALPAKGAVTDAQKKEDEVEQTWWGLAWFVAIIATMSLGIVATLARDFVPGGLAPPIQ